MNNSKLNADTANQFTADYTFDKATMLAQIKEFGGDLEAMAQKVGGYLFGISQLPDSEREDCILALWKVCKSTHGINVAKLGPYLSQYSLNTIKYKAGEIVARSDKRHMTIKLTALQAMSWRKADKKPKPSPSKADKPESKEEETGADAPAEQPVAAPAPELQLATTPEEHYAKIAAHIQALLDMGETAEGIEQTVALAIVSQAQAKVA